jgi:hypothetical protein
MRASRVDRRPVGHQRWRNLLFLHWPMPLEALRPLVPRELEIDLFTGQAYVSLIPFLIDESRPVGVPRALATRLLETNLRTYVRAEDGEAGIYFFSLDASSLLAVAAARLLYGLPYFPALPGRHVDAQRGLAHCVRVPKTRSARCPARRHVVGRRADGHGRRRHARSFPDRAIQPLRGPARGTLPWTGVSPPLSAPSGHAGAPVRDGAQRGRSSGAGRAAALSLFTRGRCRHLLAGTGSPLGEHTDAILKEADDGLEEIERPQASRCGLLTRGPGLPVTLCAMVVPSCRETHVRRGPHEPECSRDEADAKEQRQVP